MTSIWTMGEILVEIMRPEAGMSLAEPGIFLGPYPSGAPAIFIDTVARLGHGAGILGGVGADDFGRCCVDRLRADGVNCDFVRAVPGRATAVAFVTYFDDGSRKFIYHIDSTPAVEGDPAGIEALETPAFFHVMGCSLMASDAMRARILALAAALHARGARISFDPNIRAELLGDRPIASVVGPVMQRCSVLLPGVAELKLLAGKDSVKECVAHLFATSPLEVIVLKRGRQGCTVYTRDGCVDVPAYRVREVDPTGAGDCFDAAFLCGILEHRPWVECAQMASAAGALDAAAFGPMEGDISPATVAQVMAHGQVV